MSFDIFLAHFQNGETAPADRAAVLAVLHQQTHDSADSYGFYNVGFCDGSDVEFSAKELEIDTGAEFSNCAFHLRDFSPEVITFVYQVAVAGDMVIINAQGRDDDPKNPLTILVDESQRAHLPEELGGARFAESAESLGNLLGASVGEWQAYRDRVVGSTSQVNS